MNFGVLFCLLLAHFIADFPLQSKRILELRDSKERKKCLLGNGMHTGIHFTVSLLLSLYYFSFSLLIIIAIISASHGIIDYIKSRAILKRPFWKYSIGIFLLDQVCHLTSITCIFYFVNRNLSSWDALVILKTRLINTLNKYTLSVTFNQKLILSMVLLVIALWGVGIFIRVVLNNISQRPYKGALNLRIELIRKDRTGGAADGGFIIGILERLFIIISIVLDMSLVIGFILATKSVARLKKFDDDRFVEVFIIGSFISFVSAILIGYIIRILKIIPLLN